MHGIGGTVQQAQWDGPAGKAYARKRCILINPHTTNYWTDWAAINRIIDTVMVTYSGDRSRLYISGFSLGGRGTYEYVSRFRDRVAAAIVVSGPQYQADNSVYVNLPMWIGHCTGDGVVPPSNSETMISRIESAGGATFLRMSDGSPTGSGYLSTLHLYSLFDATGHGTAISLLLDNEEPFIWLLRHSLGATPARRNHTGAAAPKPCAVTSGSLGFTIDGRSACGHLPAPRALIDVPMSAPRVRVVLEQ
jgi:pimeloyl-ACP methyl ester carboxylesterase